MLIIIKYIIILLFVTSEAYGDSLDLIITSWHSDKTYTYNNKNFGIGYTKDLSRHWQLQGGYFKNSYNKDSLYLMMNLKHDMESWQWGISIGGITGYSNIEVKNYNNEAVDISSKTHSREHNMPKTKYITKYSPHSHPENLNEIQLMILPNIVWKITKKHRLQLSGMPVATKDVFLFIGLKYQFILPD